ncbi:Transthyretin-like protein 16 [Parelaphostrongylus tenuis]|uniref:Transthyretin-like protein 16 n=1 Tax=Parelaphostrongylus tenuis TaxID=148309 RepID=A0AAD5R7N4_PARTN|nr:Transthyretin-like protein 16 [Parelaphostrongylus tenuis]
MLMTWKLIDVALSNFQVSNIIYLCGQSAILEHQSYCSKAMRSFVLVALAMCLVSVMAKMQNVTVKGVAICQKKRVANIHVELYDKDTVDPNDLLADMHTNSEGEFELFGQEDEVGSIEPFLRITHNCMVSKPGCQRIADYDVPHSKIGDVYDMTYVALDIKVHGESEKC